MPASDRPVAGSFQSADHTTLFVCAPPHPCEGADKILKLERGPVKGLSNLVCPDALRAVGPLHGVHGCSTPEDVGALRRLQRRGPVRRRGPGWALACSAGSASCARRPAHRRPVGVRLRGVHVAPRPIPHPRPRLVVSTGACACGRRRSNFGFRNLEAGDFHFRSAQPPRAAWRSSSQGTPWGARKQSFSKYVKQSNFPASYI